MVADEASRLPDTVLTDVLLPMRADRNDFPKLSRGLESEITNALFNNAFFNWNALFNNAFFNWGERIRPRRILFDDASEDKRLR